MVTFNEENIANIKEAIESITYKNIDFEMFHYVREYAMIRPKHIEFKDLKTDINSLIDEQCREELEGHIYYVLYEYRGIFQYFNKETKIKEIEATHLVLNTIHNSLEQFKEREDWNIKASINLKEIKITLYEALLRRINRHIENTIKEHNKKEGENVAYI